MYVQTNNLLCRGKLRFGFLQKNQNFSLIGCKKFKLCFEPRGVMYSSMLVYVIITTHTHTYIYYIYVSWTLKCRMLPHLHSNRQFFQEAISTTYMYTFGSLNPSKEAHPQE